MTQEFIDKAATFKPDVLIIEGTRADRSNTMTEEAIKQKINEFVDKTKELVVANFPCRDIDRFNTFYEVAKATDRKLVIDLKQAYLLQMLEHGVPKIDDKNLLIYLRRLRDGMVCENVSMNCKEKDYDTWQRPFLTAKNAVTFKDLDQKKSIFYCNSYQFGELIDIKPKKGSSYIYSMCEPFNEAMELDMERVRNWLKHFNLEYNQAHASGHCSYDDLMKVVETIKAKTLIPVHTENADAFRGAKVVKNWDVVRI
jgi:ribonuclease J